MNTESTSTIFHYAIAEVAVEEIDALGLSRKTQEELIGHAESVEDAMNYAEVFADVIVPGVISQLEDRIADEENKSVKKEMRDELSILEEMTKWTYDKAELEKLARLQFEEVAEEN